jgi:hypothetical protein
VCSTWYVEGDGDPWLFARGRRHLSGTRNNRHRQAHERQIQNKCEDWKRLTQASVTETEGEKKQRVKEKPGEAAKKGT